MQQEKSRNRRRYPKDGAGVTCCGIGGRAMYTLLECLAIAGLVLVLGAGLFLAITLVVLVKAGVRAVGAGSRPWASRATTGFREELDATSLAEAAGDGN